MLQPVHLTTAQIGDCGAGHWASESGFVSTRPTDRVASQRISEQETHAAVVTRSEPRSIPIAQVNSYVPGTAGNRSTATISPSGSRTLLPKEGNTTCSEHLADSSRVNTIRSGTPTVAWMQSGINRPRTRTRATSATAPTLPSTSSGALWEKCDTLDPFFGDLSRRIVVVRGRIRECRRPVRRLRCDPAGDIDRGTLRPFGCH